MFSGSIHHSLTVEFYVQTHEKEPIVIQDLKVLKICMPLCVRDSLNNAFIGLNNDKNREQKRGKSVSRIRRQAG